MSVKNAHSPTQISIDEAEHNLSTYLRRVEAGETLVITRAGKPVAEINPFRAAVPTALRPYGLCSGEFTVPDDFDAPLPESVILDFESQ